MQCINYRLINSPIPVWEMDRSDWAVWGSIDEGLAAPFAFCCGIDLVWVIYLLHRYYYLQGGTV
jgi:hypothetical protein